MVQSILAEHAPAYGLTLCSCSHSWKNGTIKVILIYELWKEIQHSRIPLISEQFPIKTKLWLFLSRRWWNPLAFLKNCIRIVTGFHQFYCLFFLWPAEHYFTMDLMIGPFCWFVIPNSAGGPQSRRLQTWVHMGVLQGKPQWNMLSQVTSARSLDSSVQSLWWASCSRLQVCIAGEAWVWRSLPAHHLLQLPGSQTSILSSVLFPNRPRVSASLRQVCARKTPTRLPPEPTGKLHPGVIILFWHKYEIYFYLLMCS